MSNWTKGNKGFTQEEKEQHMKSFERFQDAMKRHPEEVKGQVIAINFKKKTVVKSKCRKGRKAA